MEINRNSAIAKEMRDARPEPEQSTQTVKSEPTEDQDVDMIVNAMDQDNGEQSCSPQSIKPSPVKSEQISPTKSDQAAMDVVLNKNVGVPWPTKETFAGRRKPTTEHGSELWALRRRMFYTYVPRMEWSEKNERLFFSMADEDKTTVQIVTEFKKELGY